MQFERVRIHLYSARTLQLSGRVVDSENDTFRLESDAGRMNVAHDQIHRLRIRTDDGNPGEDSSLGR